MMSSYDKPATINSNCRIAEQRNPFQQFSQTSTDIKVIKFKWILRGIVDIFARYTTLEITVLLVKVTKVI